MGDQLAAGGDVGRLGAPNRRQPTESLLSGFSRFGGLFLLGWHRRHGCGLLESGRTSTIPLARLYSSPVCRVRKRGHQETVSIFSNGSCGPFFGPANLFCPAVGLTSAILPALEPTCSWDSFQATKTGGPAVAMASLSAMSRSTLSTVSPWCRHALS